MIKLIPRTNPSPWLTVVSTIAALVATLVIGALIFTILGYDAGASLYQFFISQHLTNDITILS